jgi:hypothetical protein
MRVPAASTLTGLCWSACSLGLAGCVVGVQVPLTQAEASEGPPAPQAEAEPTGNSAPQDTAVANSASAAAERRVWVEGYWHYDGLRYVWIPGRWQDAAPRYSWGQR